MKEVEELAGRLARVQGGKTVNKNTERMYGVRRTLRAAFGPYMLNLRSTGVCEDARAALGSYDGAARVRRCVW
jgi:hypothetical protein